MYTYSRAAELHCLTIHAADACYIVHSIEFILFLLEIAVTLEIVIDNTHGLLFHHVALPFLLSSQGKADISQETHRKQTPLILATSQGHSKVVQLLLERGANPNMADEDGYTALHITLVSAVAESNPSHFELRLAIAKRLLAAGASNLKKNKHGQLPFDNMEENVVSALLKAMP